MSHVEVGHAKNIAQFRALLLHCEAFGQTYNPSNAAITVTALQHALTDANSATEALVGAKNAYDMATDHRETLFGSLAALGTRITNALSASGASQLTVNNARTHLRKLRGDRAKKVEPVQPPAPEIPGIESGETATDPALPRTVSASQLSFDQRVSHFSKLLQVVRDEPLYTPNETELSVASLQAHLAGLDAANQNVQQRLVNYENALIRRNKVLYHPQTGLTALAGDVKSYVKSVFGQSSEQFKRLGSIRLHKRA